MIRIKRDVGSASLKNAEHGDDEIWVASQAKTDPRIGCYFRAVYLAVMMTDGVGEAVGSFVKLTIGERLVVKNDCRPVRMLRRLFLEKRWDGSILGISGLGTLDGDG